MALHNKMEVSALTEQLNALKDTQNAMAAHTEELKEENGALTEKVCGLNDKVNSNYYNTRMHLLAKICKVNVNILL